MSLCLQFKEKNLLLEHGIFGPLSYGKMGNGLNGPVQEWALILPTRYIHLIFHCVLTLNFLACTDLQI